MSLLADIAAQASVKGPRCSVALTLLSMTDEDATDLRAALVNPAFTTSAIARALKNRGIPLTEHPIQRHRRGACQCP